MSYQLTILPVSFPPRDDEIFSSWLFRLAIANFSKPHTFCRFHFPGYQIWNRDIDKSAPPGLITRLSQLTDLPEQVIKNSTLKSYEGLLFENCNPNGNQKWILPLGIYHRTINRNAFQFCPRCLQKDGALPYFRKEWRLAMTVACPKCGILLHDQCPFCQKPICFYRHNMGQKESLASASVKNCIYCMSDLTKSPLYPCLIGTVAYQQKLDRYLRQGFSPRTGYSHLYFDVLYQLTKLLIQQRQRMSKFQSERLGTHQPNLAKSKRAAFELMDVISRESVITAAVRLLENWPERFIESCRRNSLLSSDLMRDFHAPYWYHNVVRTHLYAHQIGVDRRKLDS